MHTMTMPIFVQLIVDIVGGSVLIIGMADVIGRMALSTWRSFQRHIYLDDVETVKTWTTPPLPPAVEKKTAKEESK